MTDDSVVDLQETDMPRTTSPVVIAVLLKEYDSKNSPDLSPFITTANAIMIS